MHTTLKLVIASPASSNDGSFARHWTKLRKRTDIKAESDRQGSHIEADRKYTISPYMQGPGRNARTMPHR